MGSAGRGGYAGQTQQTRSYSGCQGDPGKGLVEQEDTGVVDSGLGRARVDSASWGPAAALVAGEHGGQEAGHTLWWG